MTKRTQGASGGPSPGYFAPPHFYPASPMSTPIEGAPGISHPAIEDPTAAGVTLDVRGHPRTDIRPLRALFLAWPWEPRRPFQVRRVLS